ncbi:nucleotidyltransferase family protein [Polaromonas glacialis]|uniref:nucleotidyltransferase family protein n=1 Tax=Polaromonas glacialis TaxID=866564 RepID=UPI000497A446|nr:NTP transferase domain-containing protein [Polaromonas glacialis]
MAAKPMVIVLASGRGERFVASGGSGAKLQARLGGCSVLEHTLSAVQASGLPWHLEAAMHPGMGDSIAAGVRATAGSPAWLILPGDLPLVQPETLRQIAQAPQSLDVVVPLVRTGHADDPVNGLQRGHPVRFSARCGPELMQLTGAQGAAALVRAWGETLWPVQDAGCILDIDTLADLRRAERLIGLRNFPLAG